MLTSRFPGAAEVVTPGHCAGRHDDAWQAFLRALGYAPAGAGLYAKRLTP